jgi:hypothetical protein
MGKWERRIMREEKGNKSIFTQKTKPKKPTTT